jgi:hypothetical protein
MLDNKCNNLRQEYFQAIVELELAAGMLKGYVSTEPITRGQESPAIPADNYSAASDRLEKAWTDYRDKMDAYFNCKGRQHSSASP